MSLMTDLIPWTRHRDAGLQREARDSFDGLRRELDRVFDELWRMFDAPPTRPGRDGGRAGFGWPSTELHENEREFTLAVEVPGMGEKDLEILLEDDAVVVRGERRSERSDGERQFTERYYGRFERRIPLPAAVRADGAEAKVRDGVLHVTLPKLAEARPPLRRVAIQRG